MRSPRLIFVDPPPEATVLAVVAAILALVTVAMLALVAAFWPTGSPVWPPAKGASETAQPPAQAYPAHPPEEPQPRRRMKSM